MTQKITLVRNGQGKDFDYSQDHCFVKLPSSDTGGELTMVEDQLKPGFRLPRHHHKRMTEVFYVLEGQIAFVLDDQTITLNAGDTLTIPPNVWHAAGPPAGGRMLTFFKNGRFDEYLSELGALSESQFQDQALMTSLAEKYDIFEA